MSPQNAHSRVAKIKAHNRVHMETIICPYIVSYELHYIPCIQVLTILSSRATSNTPLYSSLSAAAAARSLTPARSIPSCSHHLQETNPPGLCTVFLQRSRIVRVEIYCAALFCLFRMYNPIYVNPASSIPASSGGYYQPPSSRLFGCLTMIRRANLC